MSLDMILRIKIHRTILSASKDPAANGYAAPDAININGRLRMVCASACRSGSVILRIDCPIISSAV
jgi:hypothetical protein